MQDYWTIYSLGKDENGKILEIKDAMEAILNEKAMASKEDPLVFLEIEVIFRELASSQKFVNSYLQGYQLISSFGVKKGILNYAF